jgi:predicted permease
VDVGSLLGVIGAVMAYIALGVVLRVGGVLSAADARPLNTLLIWVAMPALIFTTVRREAFDPAFAMLPLIGWVVALVGLALAWGLTRLLKLEGPTAGAFMLAAVFGNTAYIGYPVASALLGDAGLVRAIFSDIFGNTLAVITVGTVVASRYGAGQVRTNALKELVTFPPFIALAAAMLLRSAPVPIQVTSWLDALGKLVVPVVMISVGLTLKPRALRGHLAHASVLGALKLVVLPLMALGLGALVLTDEASLRIAVLEAGVPSMLFTMIMGLRFKLDIDFIASAILLTMVGAVITIPLFQLLIG